jgi:hypothetical protein
MLRLAIIKLSAVALLITSLATSTGLPFNDPWFDISVALWVFSAITGGMPEPNEKSSFSYIWLYRTLHLLSATGTAYFIHPNKWKDISGPKDEPSERK